MGLQLRPGALVVLEGLDKTGKTTQREALARQPWDNPHPVVTHMPSGLAEISASVYRLMENEATASPLATQLLHLACHAESLPTLRAARRERGVILDRWWWSTIAYGLHGDPRVEIEDDAFLATIEAVWADFTADVVYLFDEPYADDKHNSSAIAASYAELALDAGSRAVKMPSLEPASMTKFILDELTDRDLLTRGAGVA